MEEEDRKCRVEDGVRRQTRRPRLARKQKVPPRRRMLESAQSSPSERQLTTHFSTCLLRSTSFPAHYTNVIDLLAQVFTILLDKDGAGDGLGRPTMS